MMLTLTLLWIKTHTFTSCHNPAQLFGQNAANGTERSIGSPPPPPPTENKLIFLRSLIKNVPTTCGSEPRATGAQYANLTLFKTYLHIKYSAGFTNGRYCALTEGWGVCAADGVCRSSHVYQREAVISEGWMALCCQS